MMVKQKVKGSLTFVSSFVGYTSFAGYSPYAPGKYALRGESCEQVACHILPARLHLSYHLDAH